MTDPLKLLTAAFVAPMDGPVLRDAAIVVLEDQIVDIGPASKWKKDRADCIVYDFGNAIIVPGLVNAHTHLELSHCTPGEATASFTDWVISLGKRLGPNPDFQLATQAGKAQCLQFGVTTVGDISQRAAITRGVLRGGPLRAISYGEVLGIGGSRGKVDSLLATAMDDSLSSRTLQVGISPHAPYSIDRFNYLKIARAGIDARLPIATHLAELPTEREFLEHRTGPFREFAEKFGIWRDDIETFPGGPIELAKAAGLLDYATVLAHVNYCNDAEMNLLAEGTASVVYCPRTHHYFGHPPHRFREMLARGINVSLGTDSTASSPDLNLVDDLRLVHQIAPEMSAEELWKLITINGARALQLEHMLGTISIGKAADFAVFDVNTDDSLRGILELDLQPRQTWIGGRIVV